MEKKPLKTLPFSPKKGKIHEMYQKQIGARDLREKLNQLLKLGCQQSGIPYTKNGSIVSRKVWIEWLKIFGFPENYQPQEAWLDEEGLH
jgi:hypothetical protein